MDNKPSQEAVHREMYRLSQDDCMIFNPTDTDFYIEWEGYRHLVPNKYKDIGFGKGQREVKRYLAIWYCNHMKDQLINERGAKEAQELIERRRTQGKEDFRDKYVENKEIWDKVAKTNDPNLLGEIMPGLFLGVTREFGDDFEIESNTPETKSTAEKILDELAVKKYVPSAPRETTMDLTPDSVEMPKSASKATPEVTESIVTSSKKKLAQEVTA